jgi:hypothetical protein
MDIHKPKPWRGVRDFLKEYLIIVIGVLTALAGEQVVEMLHRSGQARLAEHAMRLELAEDDGPQAYGRVLIGRCFHTQAALIHDNAAAAPADQLRKWAGAYYPPVRSWDSEAWKAVASSDAGAFMGAERLVAWSAAYRVVPGLNDMNNQESELAAELRDALPPSGEPSAADRQNLKRLAGMLQFWNDRLVRGSQLFLARTRLLGAAVPVPTQQALLSQARALYGDCATAPDPNAPAAAQKLSADLRGLH